MMTSRLVGGVVDTQGRRAKAPDDVARHREKVNIHTLRRSNYITVRDQSI